MYVHRNLSDDIKKKNSADFWKRIKFGLGCSTVTPTRIGEATSEDAVMELWRDHFGKIINSEPCASVDRERLLFEENLRKRVGDLRLPWWVVEIHPSEVEKSFKNLKLKKSSGVDEIEAEHLSFGGFELSIHMSIAFTAFLRHSFVPSQWLQSFIVPIIKDRKGDISNQDNYRGIAISCVTSKAFERVILDRIGGQLGSCERQFGFKKHHSCSDCSFVLKESIQHYLARGNKEMYLCGLDLSKAYDRVSCYRLFNKLLKLECPIYVVKFLNAWYVDQQTRIKWNNRLSQPFGVRNGLRQGSVLSPILFNVYIDDLLQQLEKSGDGARLGGIYVGALAYADDITLLSPTVSGMQRLLDICSSYTENHNLIFNCQKTTVVAFAKCQCRAPSYPSFLVGDKYVSGGQSILHLGVVLDQFCRDSVSVDDRVRRYFRAVNASVARLGGNCLSDVAWTAIVDSQLFPILTYGSQLWDISRSSTAKLLDQAYRKGIRRGLGMRRRDSIRERLGEWFVEASERVEMQQTLFMKRAVHSPNGLARTMSWLANREKSTSLNFFFMVV